LVSDILVGDGKIANIFFLCKLTLSFVCRFIYKDEQYLRYCKERSPLVR
jgi:hypothetical protein